MKPVVYDASALLAVMFDEPGSQRVIELLAQGDGEVSAVNGAEVGAKLAERGLKEPRIAREVAAFGLKIVAFDAEQAMAAAALRPLTRALGLSFGDCCCLALARLHRARAVTADVTWQRVHGVEIVAVRDP